AREPYDPVGDPRPYAVGEGDDVSPKGRRCHVVPWDAKESEADQESQQSASTPAPCGAPPDQAETSAEFQTSSRVQVPRTEASRGSSREPPPAHVVCDHIQGDVEQTEPEASSESAGHPSRLLP